MSHMATHNDPEARLRGLPGLSDAEVQRYGRHLVLPEVGFVDFVNRDEPPEAVAERMACFVEAAEA